MRLLLLKILCLSLPLLLLLPGIAYFVYPAGSPFSDLTISHYPNVIFLRQSLSAYNEIPLWSNTILSGYPFAANPLSGLWYPPGLLLIVLPLPLGFNLLVALHMVWNGVGMYLLLRQRGIQELPAICGGLVVALFPKTFAHFSAGHVSFIFAVAWTPWLLLAEHHREYRARRPLRLLPSLVMGMILLADVRWGLYAAGLWLFYSMSLVFPGGFRDRPVLSWVKTIIAQVTVASFIAAPLLLPLLQYTRLSTRQIMTASDNLTLSLPPQHLLGLLYPSLAGNWEWIIYPGAATLLISIWTILTPELRERCRFWVIILALTMFMAIGPGIPIIVTLFKYIVQLPGLDLLRVPTRVLFLSGIALSILNAEGLQYLADARKTVGENKRFSPSLVVVAITAFALLLAVGIYAVTGEISVHFVWGAAALSMVCTLLLLRQSAKIPGGAWQAVILLLLAFDLAGASLLRFDFRAPARVLAEGRSAIEYLASQEGLFRVYSPSYSLPQHTAAAARLELADGIDPLMLKTYTKFMEKATGVPQSGYNVTLPPLIGDDIHQANRHYRPNPLALGYLNVRFVVSEFPLAVSGLTLAHRAGSSWIYENQHALPRAWIQNRDDPIGSNIRPVQSIYWSPNRIEIEANGAGLLVLSEIDYPGWIVYVNGVKQPIVPVLGLLRGVQLAGPDDQVVFEYRPLWMYLGLALAALGWGLVFYSMRSVRNVH